VDLYSAFIVVRHTQGAQVRISQCYLQITPYLPRPRKRSPDGASPDWGCWHLIAVYYSFIYPERMKGWVGLVGWPTADGLPTKVVTRQPQVERRTAKVRLSETDVLPLRHATSHLMSAFASVYLRGVIIDIVIQWSSALHLASEGAMTALRLCVLMELSTVSYIWTLETGGACMFLRTRCRCID